jgi:hypothetical protein
VSQVPREPCKCRLHNSPAVSARASLRTSLPRGGRSRREMAGALQEGVRGRAERVARISERLRLRRGSWAFRAWSIGSGRYEISSCSGTLAENTRFRPSHLAL